MSLLILILVILLILGGAPPIAGNWHSYGWAPSSLGTVLLIVLLVLLLSGRLNL